MLYTTLNKIRRHKPCESGWQKLLAHLGKTQADDEPLSLATVYEVNGLGEAVWFLRAVDDCDDFARRFALDCARSVEHLTADPRVKACNDTTERYLAGRATEKDLVAAKAAARAAASNAGRADASDAGRAAAWAASASHPARHAVICAASAAAWHAAAWDAATWDVTNAVAWHVLGAHFIACLNAWPKGEWPKPPKLTKSMES